MFKIALIVCVYIVAVIILGLIVPPGIEDKSYNCIVQSDGYCYYPKVWNPAFVGGFFIISLITVVLTGLSLAPSPESAAYVMTLAETWSKIPSSDKALYKIPHLRFAQFVLAQPIDGGKKQRLWYKNPWDNDKINVLTLNMMSDYATTTIGIRQKSPVCSWTDKPFAMNTISGLLSSRERDLISKTIQLEDELNRRNLISGPVADLYQESLEQKRDKMKKQGEMNG